jgi:hypothetical protein
MSATRPEADTEYSRGPRASKGPQRGAGGAQTRPGNRAPLALVAAVVVGAVLLVVAEFSPLLRVHSGAYHAGVVQTIGGGSHHSYALLPVAVLALSMAAVARASGSRLALASIGVLGLVALGVALLGDLPDAHATGLIRQGGTYVPASSSVAIGFYLETLGAVILLVGGATGLLLSAPAGALRPSWRHRTIVRGRSAS